MHGGHPDGSPPSQPPGAIPRGNRPSGNRGNGAERNDHEKSMDLASGGEISAEAEDAALPPDRTGLQLLRRRTGENVPVPEQGDRYADAGGAIGSALSIDPTRPVYVDPSDPTYEFFGGYYQPSQPGSDKFDSRWKYTLSAELFLRLRENPSETFVDHVRTAVSMDYRLSRRQSLEFIARMDNEIQVREPMDRFYLGIVYHLKN